MSVSTYRTRPLTVQAAQFDGGNLDEFAALLDGAASAFLNGDSTLTVTQEGHEDRRVLLNWWVSRDGTGVTVHSSHAFDLIFGPATS
jgi:hypothetical protein